MADLEECGQRLYVRLLIGLLRRSLRRRRDLLMENLVLCQQLAAMRGSQSEGDYTVDLPGCERCP